MCLAEITTDNPNVWFELGYAIASQKEVVLVCGKERTSKFPFDIQHRSIITYATDSPRDFLELKKRIADRIKAILVKEETLEVAASISPVATVEGLAQHEIVTLVSTAQNMDNPQDRVFVDAVRRDMERSGFTKLATTLGLNALLKKGFIDVDTGFDPEANEGYTVYWLTNVGMQWLFDNQARLVLRADTQKEPDVTF